MPHRTLPGLLLLVAVSLAALANARPPNIVLIMADDLGVEGLGCYGSESYQTPNLDRLAGEGVRFANAHALPLCTPTRVSLMTGKHNFRNWLAFGILDPQARTFGHWLSEAGYRSAIVGKWQLRSYNPPDFEPEWRDRGMRPEDAGFDEYFLWHTEHTEDKGSRYPDPRIQDNGTYLKNTDGKYGPDLFADYACDFIERSRAEPFFLYYPMALTHDPIQPTPDSPDWKSDRERIDVSYFPDMVAYMDKIVGRLWDKLVEQGIEQDTLFLFYSDNGTLRTVTSRTQDGREIVGGKGLANLRGTHVPLIAVWPGQTSRGLVAEDLVDSNDIVPTLFEAAGIRPPEGETFDGQSFLPQLRGSGAPRRDWLYFYFDMLPGHKKIGYEKRVWAMDKRYSLFEHSGALYDLIADPEQTAPLPAAKDTPDSAVARAKLQAVLDVYGAQRR